MFSGLWIVADMDGTILSTPSKAQGKYKPISTSPCFAPLTKFVAGGGNLCVVSTAGRRMWAQVFDDMKPFLVGPTAGNLLLCGFSGAALFQFDKESQSMKEVGEYRLRALNGTTTVLPPENICEIEATVRRALLTSYERMYSEEGYLELLSKKYHQPMRQLLKEIVDVRGESLLDSPLLSLGAMKQHGLYLTETNDALLDVQYIPSADSPAAQITALGVPMARASEIFTEDLVLRLEELGVRVKFQPNSVVVARTGMDKATVVSYLRDSKLCGFDLDRAVAFGDVPESIDRPLALFPPMQFVSVAMCPTPRDPPAIINVGGEEEGTASFLEALLPQLASQRTVRRELLDEVAKGVRTEKMIASI